MEAKTNPTLIIRMMNSCTYMYMYVCMYVVIRYPYAHHALVYNVLIVHVQCMHAHEGSW